jgi:microcin C transport system substrate-binding protein
MIRSLSLLIFFTLIFTCGNADAKHSLCRYGKGKYDDSFKNFDYVNANAPKGGELKLATIGTFDTLNRDSIQGICNELASLTNDTLLKRSDDEPFSGYPLIATDVDVADDASWIYFKLNPKARFHDGTPITSEDVKFTLEYLEKQGRPNHRRYYSQVDHMDVYSPLEIKIWFKKESKEYDKELPVIIAKAMPILSKKFFKGKDYQSLGKEPLMGSGAYKIKEFQFGRFITFERVKDYWAHDLAVSQGVHNFDTIRVDYYKNAKAQFQAFLAGEYDFFSESDWQQWNNGYVGPNIEKKKIIKVSHEHKRPSVVRVIGFNMKRPLFDDRYVRQALLYAFDFDTLNRLFFDNTYRRMNSLFANTSLAAVNGLDQKQKDILNPFLKDLPDDIFDDIQLPTTNGPESQRANLKKADQLLIDAGWIIENGKRINKETKKPLNLEVILKDPIWEKVFLFYAQNLKKLGITLTIRFLDPTQYESRVFNRDFDMIVHVYANSLAPGNEQRYYFSSDEAKKPGSGNYFAIQSNVLDHITKGIVNTTNYDELTSWVRCLDRVYMKEVYGIPLVYDNLYRYAYWKDRIRLPEFNPSVGINVPSWGWSAAMDDHSESIMESEVPLKVSHAKVKTIKKNAKRYAMSAPIKTVKAKIKVALKSKKKRKKKHH